MPAGAARCAAILVAAPSATAPLISFQRLEYASGAHSGTDAHGAHAVFLTVPAHAVEQRRRTDGAGRAQRMTEGDRTSERIHFLAIKPEIANDGQALGGECLVKLDPVQIIEFETGLLQHFRNRELRADTHDLGRDAGDGEAEKPPERLQIEALERAFAH